MNLEKVIFGFFIILALTLNIGFVIGDIDNPDHHSVYELAAAIIVNYFATGLKLGDRSHIGAVLLAASLVADLQLTAAALVWGGAVHIADVGLVSPVLTAIVSLVGGAIAANVISVILLMIETVIIRR
jgi:hypothetical protein